MVLLYLQLGLYLQPQFLIQFDYVYFSGCPMLNAMEGISLGCGLVSWVMVVQ